MGDDITSHEKSLKDSEDRLKEERRHLHAMQDGYEQVSKKSHHFLNEVSELLRGSEDNYYFQDLESLHHQTSRKVQIYFQEQDAYLKQEQRRLEDDKEDFKKLKEEEESNDGS